MSALICSFLPLTPFLHLFLSLSLSLPLSLSFSSPLSLSIVLFLSLPSSLFIFLDRIQCPHWSALFFPSLPSPSLSLPLFLFPSPSFFFLPFLFLSFSFSPFPTLYSSFLIIDRLWQVHSTAFSVCTDLLFSFPHSLPPSLSLSFSFPPRLSFSLPPSLSLSMALFLSLPPLSIYLSSPHSVSTPICSFLPLTLFLPRFLSSLSLSPLLFIVFFLSFLPSLFIFLDHWSVLAGPLDRIRCPHWSALFFPSLPLFPLFLSLFLSPLSLFIVLFLSPFPPLYSSF